MTVYIVDRKEYGDTFIHGIFSSIEYAEKYVEENFDEDDDFTIMEFDVDVLVPYLNTINE